MIFYIPQRQLSPVALWINEHYSCRVWYCFEQNTDKQTRKHGIVFQMSSHRALYVALVLVGYLDGRISAKTLCDAHASNLFKSSFPSRIHFGGLFHGRSILFLRGKCTRVACLLQSLLFLQLVQQEIYSFGNVISCLNKVLNIYKINSCK